MMYKRKTSSSKQSDEHEPIIVKDFEWLIKQFKNKETRGNGLVFLVLLIVIIIVGWAIRADFMKPLNGNGDSNIHEFVTKPFSVLPNPSDQDCFISGKDKLKAVIDQKNQKITMGGTRGGVGETVIECNFNVKNEVNQVIYNVSSFDIRGSYWIEINGQRPYKEQYEEKLHKLVPFVFTASFKPTKNINIRFRFRDPWEGVRTFFKQVQPTVTFKRTVH